MRIFIKTNDLPLVTSDDVGKIITVSNDLKYVLSNNTGSTGKGIEKWTNKSYSKDDLVIYNNFFYISLVENTTDSEFIPSEWKLLHEIDSDGKIRLYEGADKDYLSNLLDNSTLKIEGDKLIAKTLSGLTVTVTDLNKINDIGLSIEELKQSISNSMRFIDVVGSLDELTGEYKAGDTVIVSSITETMTYIYNGSEWKAVAEFNMSIRDFITNPIDLTKEVTGILPQDKMDMNGLAKLTDLESFLTSDNFKGINGIELIKEGKNISISISDLPETTFKKWEASALDKVGVFIFYERKLYKCIEENSDATFDKNKYEYILGYSQGTYICRTQEEYDALPEDLKSDPNIYFFVLEDEIGDATVNESKVKEIIGNTIKAGSNINIVKNGDGTLIISSTATGSGSDEYLTVEKFKGVEEDSVKYADNITSAKNTQPLQYYGTDSNNEIGFHYLPTNIKDNTGIEQRIILDAKINESITIDSLLDISDTKITIDSYKFIAGDQDVIQTIKTFNNAASENFFYNKDIIEFDNGMHIKKEYSYNTSLNDDNLYESEIINKSEFLSIIKLEGVNA